MRAHRHSTIQLVVFPVHLGQSGLLCDCARSTVTAGRHRWANRREDVHLDHLDEIASPLAVLEISGSAAARRTFSSGSTSIWQVPPRASMSILLVLRGGRQKGDKSDKNIVKKRNSARRDTQLRGSIKGQYKDHLDRKRSRKVAGMSVVLRVSCCAPGPNAQPVSNLITVNLL